MKIKAHLVSLVLALSLFGGLQFAWKQMADVVWFESAVGLTAHERKVLDPDPDTYIARVSGYKVVECDFIKDSELGYVRVAGPEGIELVESDFSFIRDPSPGSTRPVSWFLKQNMGLWQWVDLEPEYRVTHVLATVGHDCGDGDIRTTKLGPFPVPFPVPSEDS